MKKLNVVLLFVFLLVSCSPNVTAVPTLIPTQTFTETPTLTPTLTKTSTPTITPTPLPITFIYQDNVRLDARNVQEQSAYNSYLYYSKYVDLGTIVIYTFSDLEQIIDEVQPIMHAESNMSKSQLREVWPRTGGMGSAFNGVFVINSNHFETDLCYIANNISHEIFHTVQAKLLNKVLRPDITPYGPEWLKEGSAQVMSFRLNTDVECAKTNDINQWKRNVIGSASLREYERNIGKEKFWDIAPLAVSYLLEISPNDEESLIQYYSEIGLGKTWQEAFQLSFGLSVEDFYEKFNAFRLDFETIYKATSTAEAELSSSVCGIQTDNRVNCIGKKIDDSGKEVYVFRIQPFNLPAPDQWNIVSNCRVISAGYWPVSSDTYDIVFNLSVFSKGECKVEFTFSADQQVVVHLVLP